MCIDLACGRLAGAFIVCLMACSSAEISGAATMGTAVDSRGGMAGAPQDTPAQAGSVKQEASVVGEGGSAGSNDASPEAGTDASADASEDPTREGGSLCPPSAVICEDFENGNLDPWTKLESGGVLAIDDTQFSSGKHALSITIPGNQRGGFLERKGAPLFPLTNNTIWGRMMVYFDSLPDGHTDFVRAAPTGGNPPWYNVGEQHGAVMLNYYSSVSDCWARPSPSKPLPLKKWMCWEWSFDGSKNEMQFFIDGQPSRRVSGTGDGCSGPNVWTAPQFATLRLGEYIAQTSGTPTKMWLDTVAVGTEGRIGCPSPP